MVASAGRVRGYASRFGAVDRGGDVVVPGAFARSLAHLAETGRRVAFLWQHDPARPIGVWDRVVEDDTGLLCEGRLLDGVEAGREATALMAAGALDGLSIGYRVVRAEKGPRGQGRRLLEIDLWEVSLVTFPMLSTARAGLVEASPPGGGRETRAALAAALAGALGDRARTEEAGS
ncbi:MAG: HK97 family phage prohead protease [Paracoccaceae bacterium]